MDDFFLSVLGIILISGVIAGLIAILDTYLPWGKL